MSFYPRCYSLWDRDDQQLFFEDFHLSAAEAILHRIAKGREDVPEALYRFSMTICREKVEKARYLASWDGDNDDFGDDLHALAEGEVFGMSEAQRGSITWRDILCYIEDNPVITMYSLY